MRAHDRRDFNESTISNELFWGVVAVALAAVCAAAEGVRKKYVLADQVSEPKAMPVPATTPEQKRPINCGTGHCSCIECVMPDGPLYQPATAPEQCGHCGRRVLDAPWPTRDYKTTAPEHQAVIVNPIPVEYQYHYPDGAWRCSNGLEINGSKPTASRALYAERDKQ